MGKGCDKKIRKTVHFGTILEAYVPDCFGDKGFPEIREYQKNCTQSHINFKPSVLFVCHRKRHST